MRSKTEAIIALRVDPEPTHFCNEPKSQVSIATVLRPARFPSPSRPAM
jgi:hypothetical protein